jgi:energy-coupling factor transporter ATP-binding protein EcfA2
MLYESLRNLAAALERRAAMAPGPKRAARAERLRRHVVDYLLPRAADAGAPVVVVLLGPTGSGKSSLFNALAGRAVSPSGVLRPTTRRPTVLAHPSDVSPDLLPGLNARGDLEVVTSSDARRGLVVVDSPDFDSVELANRELAVELLEAADLVVFVTTATRYADEVPWTILARARQRGVPLLAVLNRLAADTADAEAVIADYRNLLERGRLADAGAFGRLEVVAVREGAIDSVRDSLGAEETAPLREALDRLTADDEERRQLARRSLTSALEGLPTAIEEVARDLDEEGASAAALKDIADRAYRRQRAALATEIERGTFLRAEVLRQWMDFVGAGQVARFLAQGIGRLAATVRGLLRPGPPAPAAEVREAAFADLVALATQHADAAARHTAGEWLGDPHGARALAADGSLWGASSELGDRLSADLEGWALELAESIRALGEQRKGMAQAASIGINVVSTSAILAVFVHTGGLTGTEVGIAAGAAVVNQKLLEAVFGEANVASFVARGRRRLAEVLDAAFDEDRRRYEDGLGDLRDAAALADDLRAATRALDEAQPA